MRVAARVHGASDLRNPQLNVVMLEERERQAELVAVEGVLWFADHDVLGPAMRIAQYWPPRIVRACRLLREFVAFAWLVIDNKVSSDAL